MTFFVKPQLKAAEAIYHGGKFAEAYTAYSTITQFDPTNALALERLGSIALWNNHPHEAIRYLTEALARASGLQKLWPFSTQLKVRLAMAYYRADRFVEAARCFKEAAGPIARGPFRQLQALGNWLAFFDTGELYAIEGPDETRMEFVMTDPLPVVHVSIGSRDSLHFLIDTGGSEIILDAQLAKAVGVQLATTMMGEFAGSKQATMGLGSLDSIGLGEFSVKNVPVHTLDLSTLAPLFGGLDIAGIIGTRLLMHFLSTIDYRDGALILRRATPENLKRAVAPAEADQARYIPFWLIDTHYILAWGTVNRLGPMLFWVDTGLADKGFIPSAAVLREAGIVVDWSKAHEGVGGGGKVKEASIVLEQLTLGEGPNEIVEHNVPGVVMEQQPVLGDQFGFEISGIISHQFFRNYSLTFDFQHMRMILQ